MIRPLPPISFELHAARQLRWTFSDRVTLDTAREREAVRERVRFGRTIMEAVRRPPPAVGYPWCAWGVLYELDGAELAFEARRVAEVIRAHGWCRARECLTCGDVGTGTCVIARHAWFCAAPREQR